MAFLMLTIYLYQNYLSICLSIYLSVCLSIYLSIHLDLPRAPPGGRQLHEEGAVLGPQAHGARRRSVRGLREVHTRE